MWALGAAEQPGATLSFLHYGQKEPLREREAVAMPYFDFQVFFPIGTSLVGSHCNQKAALVYTTG